MHGYENTIIGGVEMYLPKSWISAIERHRQSALGETVIPLSVQFTNADELRKRAETAEKQLAEAQGRIVELERLVVMVQKNLKGIQQDALAAMGTQVALHIEMVLKELREGNDES